MGSLSIFFVKIGLDGTIYVGDNRDSNEGWKQMGGRIGQKNEG
jgi:hypothetical protein